jgi:hypothetical protein
MKLKARLVNLFVTVALMAAPAVGICQGPPEPVNGGGNPEVPFDSTMNIIFLSAGVLFSAFILVRQYRKRTENA